jgi:hypothetical protein
LGGGVKLRPNVPSWLPAFATVYAIVTGVPGSALAGVTTLEICGTAAASMMVVSVTSLKALAKLCEVARTVAG